MLEKRLTIPREIGKGKEDYWLDVQENMGVPQAVSLFHTDRTYLKDRDAEALCELVSYQKIETLCQGCRVSPACPSVEEQVKSYAYNFDPATGELQNVAVYEGSFNEQDFRWGERKIEDIPAEQLSSSEIASAYQAAQRFDYELKVERSTPGLTVKEQDKLDNLREALKKVVNREMPQGYQRWEKMEDEEFDEEEESFIDTIKRIGHLFSTGPSPASGQNKIQAPSGNGNGYGTLPGLGTSASKKNKDPMYKFLDGNGKFLFDDPDDKFDGKYPTIDDKGKIVK
jgi:hypothetical protein